MAFTLVSLNIGRIDKVANGDSCYETGIGKQPVSGEIYLSRMSLLGDQQADLVHHGGEDKAVCVYSYDHYPYWETQLGTKLMFAAFGENFTVSGVTEQDVAIGDIFRIGETMVQVSQPRIPCIKLGRKHNQDNLPAKVISSGYSGFYFRVLEEGKVSAGLHAELLNRHPLEVSIAEANRVMHYDKSNRSALERLLSVDALAEAWRKPLTARLLELSS